MTIKRVSAIIILIFLMTVAGCTAQPIPTPIPTVALPPTSQPAPTVAVESPAAAPAGTPVAVAKGIVPTVGVAGQQAAADVTLRAANTELAVGEALLVEVVASGVANLYGAQFTLLYDPKQLTIQDADESLGGIQISPGAAFPHGASFVALRKADPEVGRVDFAATLLNPAAPLNGDVVLASFSIMGKQAGSAEMAFEQVLMADRQGNALPVNYTDKTFQVR